MIKQILTQIDKEITYFSKTRNFDKREFLIAVEQTYLNNKRIQESYPNSISSAIITAAELGLVPNNHASHCMIYAEYGICKFYLQYKGLIKLMYDTLDVIHLDANVINKNDKFSYEAAPEVKLSHVINLLDPGDMIGVYSMVKLGSGQTFAEVIPARKMREIQAMSKSKFWDGKNDPNCWMEKKIAIKQLAKLLPPSKAISLALNQDDLSEGGKAVYIQDGEVVEADKSESARSEQEKKSDALMAEAIKKITK